MEKEHIDFSVLEEALLKIVEQLEEQNKIFRELLEFEKPLD